jgi:hypothetical protein
MKRSQAPSKKSQALYDGITKLPYFNIGGLPTEKLYFMLIVSKKSTKMKLISSQHKPIQMARAHR